MWVASGVSQPRISSPFPYPLPASWPAQRFKFFFPPPFLFPPPLPPHYFGGSFLGPLQFPHLAGVSSGKFIFASLTG